MGWRNEQLHETVNHLGTQHVAEAARRAGVRMVYVSTINTLGVGRGIARPTKSGWLAPTCPVPTC